MRNYPYTRSFTRQEMRALASLMKPKWVGFGMPGLAFRSVLVYLAGERPGDGWEPCPPQGGLPEEMPEPTTNEWWVREVPLREAMGVLIALAKHGSILFYRHWCQIGPVSKGQWLVID
jgi:hypothetical protein